MNKLVVVTMVGVGLVVGCKGSGTQPDATKGLAPSQNQHTDQHTKPDTAAQTPVKPNANDDRPVARVSGITITERELRDPLVEAYGLNVLLNLVQLQLAQKEAQRFDVTVTDADVTAERQRTLDRLFEQANVIQKSKIDEIRVKDPATADRMLADMRKDNERALDQLLAQQRVSRPEFEIVIRTNATLAKIAEPKVRAAITDEQVREAFRVQYGEKVVVRHVQTNNLTDLNEARRRLAAGESFEQVAKELSTNKSTGPLGGEVPAFTRNNEAFPQAFRDAAFSLKVGEISEAVQADGNYHLIKLEQRIDPTAVKFEDVQQAVAADLYERLLQASIRNLRQQIGRDALAGLSIDDPVLKQQFDDRLAEQQGKVRDRESVRDQLNKQRETMAVQQAQELANRAATQAASQPTTGVTTKPATRPTTTFVDDLFPAKLPATMKSVMPENQPATTQQTR